MLTYAWRRWLTLNELAIQVAHTCDRYRVDRLIIENKAAGHSLMQELHRLFADKDWATQFTDPTRKGEKEARAHSITHLFEEGMIHRPNTDWAQMVEDECSLFPRDVHDDLVDSLVQGLRFLRDIGVLSRKVEQRRRERSLEEYRGRAASKPLYAA
jgi:predicted phage terminase large subunit-like protein